MIGLVLMLIAMVAAHAGLTSVFFWVAFSLVCFIWIISGLAKIRIMFGEEDEEDEDS